MKENKVAKVAAVALLAVTLASQTVATTGAVQAETDIRVVETVSVRQSAVVSEYTQDKYTKSQVEFLMSQLIASKTETEDCDEISYTYNDLYYSPNDKAGYVIDFTYGDSCGYIIMLVDDESAKPVEIALDRQSPYYGKAGIYMYPAQGNYYILADNGNVVDAMQYTVMSNQPQNVMKMSSLGIYGDETPDERYLKYDYIVSHDEYEIPNMYSGYSTSYTDVVTGNTDGRVSPPYNCANIAGVIALNHWNKYFKNDLLKLAEEDYLIEDSYNNRHFYNMNYNVAYSYADIFYRYMKTNNWFNDVDTVWGSLIDTFAPDPIGGTLPQNGYAGFERLIKQKGYQTQRANLSTYGEIKTCILFGTPVFITAKDYRMGYLTNHEYMNRLDFEGSYYTGWVKAHTFVAYGYKEYTFYEKDGKLTTLNCFQVADGWGGVQYFIMDESTVISAAAIHVYKPTLGRC